MYMLEQKTRKFIQHQTFQINFPQTLFQSSCTVSNDLNYLFEKVLIRCDAIVPDLDKVGQNHSN